MKKTDILPRIVALVPMRHTSERVPGKNYREMAGKPLYFHILTTLKDTPEIAEVVVDTDSPDIMEGVRKYFPGVGILERPEKLRDGMIPMNEILLYDTSQVEADYYLQTHSTNPLLKAETISKAIQTFIESRDSHDSLFSVTRWQTRLYDKDGKAINHNPGELLRTQDLPPVYEENSCMYIFDRETLKERGHRIGEKPLMFEIDAIEAWDIDVELDFLIAEFLMRKRMGE
jgi:CMP-N-acetylneuraminic acid synthetase